MDYTTYQIIILLDDTLSLFRKKFITREIKDFITRFTKKIDIKYEETKKLAYKIDEHEKSWFVAMQVKLKTIGSNKRIREVKEMLNTYEEIIYFKIIQKNKSEYLENEENEIYIVYEFDYGDNIEGIEPNITIFDGYRTREKAIEKANELLQEGLEEYFIESYLADNKNPFKDNNEVHLYKNKSGNKQGNSVYYIKIEKIKLI